MMSGSWVPLRTISCRSAEIEFAIAPGAGAVSRTCSSSRFMRQPPDGGASETPPWSSSKASRAGRIVSAIASCLGLPKR